MKQKIKFFLTRGVNNTVSWMELMQEQYNLWLKGRYLRGKIKEADRRRDASNLQHYVLKEHDNRLFVASSREIKILKKAGLFQKRFNVEDLLTEAVYIAFPRTSAGLKLDHPWQRRMSRKKIKNIAKELNHVKQENQGGHQQAAPKNK